MHHLAMSTAILPREICKGPKWGLTLKMWTSLRKEEIMPAPKRPSEMR